MKAHFLLTIAMATRIIYLWFPWQLTYKYKVSPIPHEGEARGKPG